MSEASVRPMPQMQWAVIRLFKSSCCSTQEYLIKVVEISPHSASAYLHMGNDGLLYSAARRTALKNWMWKSAENEAFTYSSQIWSQFQNERCWASSDHATCRDSPRLGTSPSLPQFPVLRDQWVTFRLGEVSVILGFGLQAELEPQAADKVISVVLSLVESKLAGAF